MRRRDLLTLALLLAAAPTLGSQRAPTPDLEIVSWTVDDTTTGLGNGDGGLHPGEEVLLSITLSNQGSRNATGVSATLDERHPHPDLEILDKIAIWPDLPATGTPSASNAPHFRIRVATTRPCGWSVPLRLTLVADNGYERVVDFDVPMVDPRRIELDERAVGTFVHGRDVNDFLGRVSEFCDLDGDGLDELIVSATGGDGPLNDRGGAGEVVVIWGQAAGIPTVDLAALSGATVSTIHGEDSGDGLGDSLACGDLDGDGFEDLAIGATAADGNSNADSASGEVLVIWGSPSRLPTTVDLAAGGGPASFLIYGAEAFDELGEDVATGDLNGDGYDELIVGATGGDGSVNGLTNSGEVYIRFGGPSRPFVGFDLAFEIPQGFGWIRGADEFDILLGVETVDLDGDGFDDLVLGSPRADGPQDGFSNRGEVAIAYGGPAFDGRFWLGSPPADVAFLWSVGSGEWPESMAAGDLNGDGYGDLVLGSADAFDVGNTNGASGRVHVVYGQPERLGNTDLSDVPGIASVIYGGPSSRLGGDASSPSAPDTVAVGDVDGDGFDDLVAGTIWLDSDPDGTVGGIAIVHGGPTRLPDIDLVNPHAGVVTVSGIDPSDMLGQGLAVGDLDGDGRGEVVAGARAGDGPGNTRTSSGELLVIAGEQRSRFRHDPETSAFIDATAGTALPLACDDCGVTVPIGFEFEFYGRRYDQVTVSSNGYLSFDGEGDRPFGFCPPRSATPNALIAVFWDDLDLAARGSVYTLLEGVAPNRRLTVQWDAVPVFPDTGELTFEVTLFESSDRILMQYADVFVDTAHPSNNGAQAIVAVENAVGKNAAPFSCATASLTDGSAIGFRAFDNPTPVYYEDFESGAGLWAGNGLWHRISEPTCSPSSAAAQSAFYYGQDVSCDFDTGARTTGVLSSADLGTLPQDAALRFWQRREAETGSGFDVSLIEVQGEAGSWDLLAQNRDGTDAWRSSLSLDSPDPESGRFSSMDLSAYVGENIALRFNFDSIDGSVNGGTGWMVDDIALLACPVFNAAAAPPGAATEARATARPATVCEDQAGSVDAVGSYCTACSELTYQWSVDGVEIPGATAIELPIAPGRTPGLYDYTVEIDCSIPAPCLQTSDPAQVAVVQKPLDLGPTLRAVKSTDGTDVTWTWNDAAGADDYVLFSDVTPIDRVGGFLTAEGAAFAGGAGVTLPLSGQTRYYLVAGRNPVCGVGPR